MKYNFKLDKNICIRDFSLKDTYIFNPQMNIIYELKESLDGCIVLPQKKNNQYFDIKKNFNISDISNPLSYFELPINNNNFLEIIFNITNINNLYEWIINYNEILIDTDEILNLVLNIFWNKNFNIIENNVEDFIKLNKILIQLIYKQNIDNNILSIIIIKIIKKYAYKKIIYLKKLKKYLMRYYNKWHL